MRTLLAGCAAAILVASFPVTLIPGAAQQPPAPGSPAAAPAPAVPVPVPAVLQKYEPVTAKRLENPEPGNWLGFQTRTRGLAVGEFSAASHDDDA